MHELAICEALLQQVLNVAADHGMRQVGRITLRVGPLSGVEADQLRLAFPLVAAGTLGADATVEIESTAVQVCCEFCGTTSQVCANRLLCTQCGTWRVKLVSGDEMLLACVELLDESFV